MTDIEDARRAEMRLVALMEIATVLPRSKQLQALDELGKLVIGWDDEYSPRRQALAIHRHTIKQPTWATVACAVGFGLILGYAWRCASYAQAAANEATREQSLMALAKPHHGPPPASRPPTDAERFARGELPGVKL